MSSNLGDATLDLRTDAKAFNKGLDKAGADASRFVKTTSQKFQALGKSMAKAGRSMTTFVTLPLAGLGVAAIKMASDAEESANKFDVVMGRAASEVRARLQELTATIPLTRAEMEGLSAGVQDMLVPMGVARGQAAGMSADMVELAGDMASFNNVAPVKVLEDIQSALAGSSEPMRKYGVDTRVAALQAIALNAGLTKQGEALDNASMAQAVLLAIQKDSTDAMGDAARTVDSTANQIKFLWRDLKDLSQMIGEVLIPVVTPMIAKLGEWLKWLKELSPATQKWIVGIAAVAAGIGPLLVVLGTLVSSVGAITGAIAGAGGLIAALTGPVGLTVAAAAAGLAIGTLINDLVIGKHAWADFLVFIGMGEEAIDLNSAAMERNRRIHLETRGAINAVGTEMGRIIPIAETMAEYIERTTGNTGELTEQLIEATGAMDRFALSFQGGNTALVGLDVKATNLLASIGPLPMAFQQTGSSVSGYVEEAEKASKATDDSTLSLDGMFSAIRTGQPTLDSLIGIVGKLVGGLIGPGGLSFSFGQAGESASGFFGKIQGLFGGLGGGGLLGAGLGLAATGIGALIGLFKGFGGPDAAEMAGRSAAATYRDAIRSELSAEVLLDVQRLFPDDINNASFLASLQQKLIATGMAAEAAGAQARTWGEQLAKAEVQGGDAIQGIIAQIEAATQATAAAAAASSTISQSVLSGLRNTANSLSLPSYQTSPGQSHTVPGSRNQATLAMVHGGERISRDGGGGGEIHNHIHMGDREVALQVLKITPKILRQLGVGG